jgi:hypothetical protein
MQYSPTGLIVQAVIQPETADVDAGLAPTRSVKLVKCLHTVPGMSQMPDGTSQPVNSHNKLFSVKPQWKTSRYSLAPALQHDLTHIQYSKHVELVSFDCCISLPQRITKWKSDTDKDMLAAPASGKDR